MLLEQIKQAGIVGCGGAGFPTHVKLNCQVDTLILNGAECEPLLRTDRWLMIQKATEIVSAARMMGELVQAKRVCIALKETYLEEIAALTKAITASNSSVELFLMRNFYPAGDEQIMVCDVTGKSVPPAGIPLDVSAVVSNVATAFAIYQSCQGKGFTHKHLTITGQVASPCIVQAPLGASFTDCLKASGESLIADYHVIVGGPLMGKCYTKEEAKQLTVTKTTSGFILVPNDSPLVRARKLPMEASLKQAKSSCIQCSYCTQMCPRYLTGHPLRPHMIMRKLAYASSPKDILQDSDVTQAMICSECGLCETYACPMGLKPRQVNIHLKSLLRNENFRYSKPSGTFTSLKEREYRRVPGKRLAIRLGVDQYYDYHIDTCVELNPSHVSILLRQHIGSPSTPTVKIGSHVETGQLIAVIPPESLGANLHASITGRITEITDTAITISAVE